MGPGMDKFPQSTVNQSVREIIACQLVQFKALSSPRIRTIWRRVFCRNEKLLYLRTRKDVLRDLPIVWEFFRRFLNHMGRVVSKLG